MRVHLGRGDKILGEYEREEVEQGLQTGKFFPSDVFWMDGQGGRKELSQFLTFSKEASGMGSEISWERNTGIKSFFRTIGEVAFKPHWTFREGGRVGRGFKFFICSLGIFLIGAVVTYGALGLRVLFKRKSDLTSEAVMSEFGGAFFYLPYIFLWGLPLPVIAGIISHFFLLCTGSRSGDIRTTLNVIFYTLGTGMLFCLTPIIGPFLSVGVYVISSTFALSQCHGVGRVRAFLSVVMPILICCIAPAALLSGHR